jgi:DNA-binding CsgD family transcriptional regulator
MIQNPKHSKAVAYLRQICCSGLGSDIVIPEFLRALHHVIPSGRNWYTAVDAQFNHLYQIPDYFIPEMVTLNEVAAFTFPNLFTKEAKGCFLMWLKINPFMSNESFILYLKDFYKSDVYNLIHISLEQHYIFEFRVVLQGSIVGTVGLTRSLSSMPFNDKETALCVQLMPYVAHALAAPDKSELTYKDSGQSGMMVLDKEGAILYQSDAARQLLALSQFQSFDFKGNHDNPVYAHLKQLCRNLNAIFQDKTVPPPSWSHTNANGRFNFRAHWLKPCTQEPGGLIGINIELQEPLELKILRALGKLPLSPAQKQVAALLAQGCSFEHIGKQLHIKNSTVKDHIGKIYTKLDLHNREELLPKLLAMESSSLILGGNGYPLITFAGLVNPANAASAVLGFR